MSAYRSVAVITAQIEQEQRDSLHRDLAALVVEDPRREAWFAVDNLSSQWVTAGRHPSRSALGAHGTTGHRARKGGEGAGEGHGEGGGGKVRGGRKGSKRLSRRRRKKRGESREGREGA